MKLRMLMALALAGALTAAACGGDDDDSGDDAGNGAGGDTTQTAGVGTPSGGNDSSATPATGDDEPVPDLLAEASDKTYSVTYEVAFTVDGETQEGEMTFAQKPPKSLMKIAISGSGDFEELTVIDDGKDSLSCFKTGDSGQCLKSLGAGGAGENFTLFDMKKVTESVKEDKNVKEVSGQKIAGRDSRCFEGTFDETNERSTVCIDKRDGILTLVESPSTKVKATEISDKADDKLFEAPYPIIG